MKKLLLFLTVFCSAICYSQTWEETNPADDSMSVGYTVITRQEFDRLLRQNEARFEFAILEFEDVLEMQNWRVTSGRRPPLSGYYYLIGRISSTNPEIQGLLALMGATNYLVYGNSETGRMTITFMNTFGALTFGLALQNVVSVSSNDYFNRFNQFISFVNGE
ncbi:MAG: hypothetical protein FWD87_08165 [Spirochaetaceae bacterium]|nr:hypothetical protein [Spirochaetaceae bacterium]